MSTTRLSNIEKRLEYVAGRMKSFRGEEGGVIASLLLIILRSAQRTLPLSVAVWSILELPLELFLAQSSTERFASVAGRLIWVALAIATIFKMRLARVMFIFLCAVSSIVVAQALPMAYESSPLVFSVLVIDLLLKVLTLWISLTPTLVAKNSA
ncbi:hypothetical protein GCT13_44415 [Paraburkholderia sp. CNPSo 3157]|uniref:Uncharacterized protein n=1 Tax=Paraburkholderia franconis TaxID=2654983 RepID=A0A7X1NKB5_9BURK|nr:hypothetical protein [Paraburkholderia franconis]MPW23583.1 hypothetical protein [Paraburkholderia franconis]